MISDPRWNPPATIAHTHNLPPPDPESSFYKQDESENSDDCQIVFENLSPFLIEEKTNDPENPVHSFFPTKVVKQILEHTTKFACISMHQTMQSIYRSLFHAKNVPRCNKRSTLWHCVIVHSSNCWWLCCSRTLQCQNSHISYLFITSWSWVVCIFFHLMSPDKAYLWCFEAQVLL